MQAVSIAERQRPETISQPQSIGGPETSSTQGEFDPMLTMPKQLLSPGMFMGDIPPYHKPNLRPPPRLPDLRESWKTLMDLDTNIDINTDFEEKSRM